MVSKVLLGRAVARCLQILVLTNTVVLGSNYFTVDGLSEEWPFLVNSVAGPADKLQGNAFICCQRMYWKAALNLSSTPS